MFFLIDLLNLFLTRVFGWLLLPFRNLAPIWGLTFISLATGLLMLWIFGLVSNQEAIRRIKDRIRGNLLAVRLYQHDVAIVLRSQARIFRDTFIYMKYTLVPMTVLMVPVILIIIQLHLYFAARPALPGESLIVKVELRDASLPAGEGVDLETPEAVEVETPPVRIPLQSEVDWRIRAKEEGIHLLRVRAGKDEFTKELTAGRGWGPVNVRRTGKSWWDLLLYPGEKSIPFSAVEAIELTYTPLPISLFGWKVNWLVFFFVASVVFGFAFKGFFGIEV